MQGGRAKPPIAAPARTGLWGYRGYGDSALNFEVAPLGRHRRVDLTASFFPDSVDFTFGSTQPMLCLNHGNQNVSCAEMPPPARTAKHRVRCGPPAVAERERIPGFRRRILQSPDEWEGNFPTRKPLIRHKTGKESRSSAVHVLSQSQT